MNKTDITILLDRSGSMQTVQDDTIGGFNKFLEDQRAAPDTASLSLIQFDNIYEPVYIGKDIKEARNLDRSTFVPRGTTALLDAICRSIDETGKRLDSLQEKPALVIFVILTDGFENSSTKFTVADVSNRISHQRDVYQWQFVFLGANQDAIAEATKLGIGSQHALTYQNKSGNVQHAYAALSSNVKAARSSASKGLGGSVIASNLAWHPKQRKEQE